MNVLGEKELYGEKFFVVLHGDSISFVCGNNTYVYYCKAFDP
jgi:hypothetical protein